MHKWWAVDSLVSALVVAGYFFKRRRGKGMQVERSVLKVATEEQKHVEKHLELFGDTYDLTTLLESLYDSLPPQCRFPLDVATNNPGHAAGINAHLMLICRRELTTG